MKKILGFDVIARTKNEAISSLGLPRANKLALAMTFCVTSYFLLPTYCLSDSFKILGTRPLALGGAYVAIGEDAITQYWNPAGLGIGKDVDVQIPVGVKLEATGDILGSAERLSDIADKFSDISAAQKGGKAISLDQLSAFATGIKELDNLNDPSKGILVDVNAGANIRVSHFAVSVNNFTSFGCDPSIDIKNLGLGKGTFSSAPSPSVRKADLPDGPEEFEGVDLGDIINDFNSSYVGPDGKKIFETPTDPTLASSANTLSSGILGDINTTLKDLGIDTTIDPSINLGGLSVEQALANAIVRAATDPTIAAQLGTTALTPAEIADYTKQINDAWPLVKSIIESNLSGSSSYAKNKSNLTVRGASVFEASLGYGRKAPYVQSTAVLGGILKGLYVGGNLKYMKGYVGYAKAQVLSDDEVDPFDDLTDNQKISNKIGLDLGLLLKKERLLIFKKTQFGLLLRNINSPSFDQPAEAVSDGEGSKYKMSPQIRGAVALWPFNWWTISSDLDLTKNSTPLPGYFSRLWGLGNEFNLVNSEWFNLALRCGLMKNMAESSSKLAYTGGFGLTLAHFVIDFGGAMSTDMVEVTGGTEVPASGAAALTISFDF
ncbi:MAG: conjugal transfer protein TraF [Elusimicrobia bacterium]|nr:conjugal transfer protein TraF [Elusimicrobiota bacterium]